MKNLKNYRVKEMSESSAILINGGTWLGYAVGFAFGGALRYSGALGVGRFSTDMAAYFAKK